MSSEVSPKASFEALASYAETIEDTRTVFVSGKGGVGKSTVALDLARHLSEAGKLTLLVEMADRQSLPELARNHGLPDEQDDATHQGQTGEPILGQEWPMSANLRGITITGESCFREYVTKYLGQTQLFEQIFRQKTVHAFVQALPGMAEALMLGRIMFSATLRKPRVYDHIVVDAPASGHFLSLLSTPQSMLNAGVMGTFAKEMQRIQSFLADPKLATSMYVTTPEPLVVQECLEFIDLVKTRTQTPVQHLILNRFFGAETQPKPQASSDNVHPSAPGGQKEDPLTAEGRAWLGHKQQQSQQARQQLEGFCQTESICYQEISEHGHLINPSPSQYRKKAHR